MEVQARGQGEKTVASPPFACAAVHWLTCAVLLSCCLVISPLTPLLGNNCRRNCEGHASLEHHMPICLPTLLWYQLPASFPSVSQNKFLL